MDSPDEIVTIARFNLPTNAHVARAALEAAGIDAIVVNDGVINLDIYMALPERIVRLQVRAADAERACRVLGMNRPAAAHESSVKPLQASVCARCGSGAMQPIPYTLLGGLLNALKSLYDPALARRRWRCPACGHQMEDHG